MIHPSLSQWQQAKKSAMALAAHMGAEIIQSPDGQRKRVILRGGKITDCTSWYGAYCYLHRIALDRISAQRRHEPQARHQPPPIARRAPPEPPHSPMLDEPWKC